MASERRRYQGVIKDPIDRSFTLPSRGSSRGFKSSHRDHLIE